MTCLETYIFNFMKNLTPQKDEVLEKVKNINSDELLRETNAKILDKLADKISDKFIEDLLHKEIENEIF